VSHDVINELNAYERRIEELNAERLAYLDKHTQFRAQALKLRAQISSKESALTLFDTLRAKEEKLQEGTVDDISDDISQDIKSDLNVYKKKLKLLKQACKRDFESIDLHSALASFGARLQELEKSIKEPMHVSIMLEHLHVLVHAARDLIYSASWKNMTKRRDAIWDSLKTAVDGLLEMTKQKLHSAPSQDELSGATPDVDPNLYYERDVSPCISDEDEENQRELGSENSGDFMTIGLYAKNMPKKEEVNEDVAEYDDELVSIDLNAEDDIEENPEEKLTHEAVDNKIKLLMTQWLSIQSVMPAEISKRDVQKVQSNTTLILDSAKKQDDFKLTPIQKAALQELRAETGQLMMKLAWDKLKQQPEKAFSAAKERFKQLTQSDSEAEAHDDNNSPKKK
jgi:hypothetical protein